MPYFYDIRAYHVLDRFIMSHIPIHEESKARFLGNIHGHMHGNKLADPWYLNVSVEQIDYTPITFDAAKETILSNIDKSGGKQDTILPE